MRWTIEIFLAGCLALAAADGPEIISKIPGYQREFKIVAKKFSADGREAAFTILEPGGIFAFRLDLANTKLSKLTFMVQKQKHCEGLTFQPDGQKEIDLKHAAGVKISQAGEDLVIEFAPAALEKMKPAGRFQFINQYR